MYGRLDLAGFWALFEPFLGPGRAQNRPLLGRSRGPYGAKYSLRDVQPAQGPPRRALQEGPKYPYFSPILGPILRAQIGPNHVYGRLGLASFRAILGPKIGLFGAYLGPWEGPNDPKIGHFPVYAPMYGLCSPPVGAQNRGI